MPAARVALVGVGVVGYEIHASSHIPSLAKIVDKFIHSVLVVESLSATRQPLIDFRKSQLAIEYVYRLRKQTPEDTWVLWIHASNATRFEKSFRDIVDFLKIFGRKDPKANIYELVRDRLRNGKKGRWLLVLDSADDTSFLVDSSAQKLGQRTSDHNRAGRLLDYLPICDYSAILVTTRNQKVASELVDDGDIVVVQPMAEQRAVTLLKKKIGDQFQENDLIELATTLEFMPLAIAHAAAFIKHRVPRYSGQHYLDEFRRNDRSKTSLLYYNLGHFRRDIEYTNSIILTWQISFEHIFQTRRSAADLLSLMSFFDPQAIPESLLIHRDGEAYDSGETSSILGNAWRSILSAIQMLTFAEIKLKLVRQRPAMGKRLKSMSELFETTHSSPSPPIIRRSECIDLCSLLQGAG